MERECYPCTMVGHSYGGAKALQLAVDFPITPMPLFPWQAQLLPITNPKWYNTLAQSSWITLNRWTFE